LVWFCWSSFVQLVCAKTRPTNHTQAQEEEEEEMINSAFIQELNNLMSLSSSNPHIKTTYKKVN
jgi:hypothetical protein